MDIMKFTLANEALCTNFMCYVTCHNADKTFWIVNGNFILYVEIRAQSKIGYGKSRQEKSSGTD